MVQSIDIALTKFYPKVCVTTE